MHASPRSRNLSRSADLLRATWRRIGRAKGFACVIVLLISSAVGAAATAYSLLYGVILRPLPYRDAERIAVVSEWRNGEKDAYVGGDVIKALRAPSSPLEDCATFVNTSANATTRTGIAQLSGYVVSPNLFRVLGVRSWLGRSFDSTTATNGPVIVLSYDAWHDRFAMDKTIVGRNVIINGTPRLVIGVMPRGVRFPDSRAFHRIDRPDFWMPFAGGAPPFGLVIGRYRDRASRADLQRYLDYVASRVSTSSDIASVQLRAASLPDEDTREVKGPLLLLGAATSVLLLVLLGNVAALWIYRFSSRSHEIGIRAALGGTPRQLALEWLGEAVALLILGFILGLIGASVTLRLVADAGPREVPRLEDVVMSWRVAALCAAVAVFVLIPVIILPITRAVRRTLSSDFASRGAVKRRVSRSELRWILGLETGFATVLAILAIVLMVTVQSLTAAPLGFRPDHVLMIDVNATIHSPADFLRSNGLFERVVGTLDELPGVEAVTSAYPAPFSDVASQGAVAQIEDAAEASSGQEVSRGDVSLIVPGYFKTMGIRLTAGRDFSHHVSEDRHVTAVIDSVAAARLWPGQPAVGRRVRTNFFFDTTSAEVIGVVAHTRFASVDEASVPQLYLPLEWRPRAQRTLLVRVKPDAPSGPAAVRLSLSTFAGLGIGDVRWLSDTVSQSFGVRTFAERIAVGCAVLAVIFGLVGAFGLTALVSIERSHELAVRAALGGRQHQLILAAARETLIAACLGCVSGGALAYIAVGAAAAGIHGLYSGSMSLAASVCVAILAFSAVAVYLPASRAAKVDPSAALRL